MTTDATVKKLPLRVDVATADTWDLTSLYASDDQWQADLQMLKDWTPQFAEFQGTLSGSAEALARCLKFDSQFDRLAEKVGTYAFLRTTEDQANGTYQKMIAQYRNVATRASEAASYIRPEILAISDDQMQQYLDSPELAHYKLILERILRYKQYTLSPKEEQILAMQGEMAQAANQAFRQLLDADLKFGNVKNEKGELVELSNATFSQLLISPERSVRQNAFHQYYEQFTSHENTLAATLAGSIHKDVYYARVRGYDSALSAALYPDNVPHAVYDNLIESVHKALPSLHRFYELRRRKMKLDDIHHYDTYVPILSDLETHRSWDDAVNLVMESLAPLGSEYSTVLEKGLRGRWCDRYPNQGKQSGAFSCGSFDADPYILMNYQPSVLNDVFTLTHEAGHSMHSYYSSQHQAFEYYDYTIFVAEVASTFNEELLSHHMLQHASSDKERAYLINREIDDI
ncbi:MAG: oligoendopeptidase F family protein, partial [Planctomycetales bacterium]|nr:oligoendopeptidase F family protein [Planctomycetales bacterium]